MEFIDKFIFVCGLILALSVLAGLLSKRSSVPILLIFLGVGMLFGEEGPGNIQFDNMGLSYLVCSIGLAVILFDGGLHTSMRQFKVGLRPAVSLATIGVLLTALGVAVVLWWMLKINFLAALLIGATVASTDAAAVFMLLHQQNIKLRKRLVATLEAESGLNDPMAIFLTISVIQLMVGDAQSGAVWMAVFFVQQMALGVIAGYVGGLFMGLALRRLELPAGLEPILGLSGALVIFGGTAMLGGSGFMAVYIAGLVVAAKTPEVRGELSGFMDGMAWLAQIVMLLILGLLVTPSKMLADLPLAMMAALVLIFFARPLAVFISLSRSRLNVREKAFVSWVGLRGAVPIFLALIPTLMGVDDGYIYFNVAFAIVVLSLVLQGWTIRPAAKLLGLHTDDPKG